MEGNARTRFTPKQRAELWERWKSGQCVSALVHIKINSANDGTTNANNLEPPRALDRRAWREILLYS